jgi:peptidase M28-like protein
MSTVPSLRRAANDKARPTGSREPPARDNPPVDAPARRRLIEELCSFTGRGPGSDAERRAANHLAKQLEDRGRRVQVEPILIHPHAALVHAVHALIAIAGSLVATASPVAGFALVLFAATSTYLDLQARFYLVRNLFYRRASQNVLSPGKRPDAPMRVILAAHYDAPRSGFVFGSPMRAINARGERARLFLGPTRIFFWLGIASLLPILGAQMAGFDPGWMKLLQLVPTMLLILSLFVLLDIALSATVEGAYDNASGVAAVLSAAEDLDADPPANIDVSVLLTGAGETLGEGMRAFLKSRGKAIRDGRTVILNVDSVSAGDPRYEISAGAVASIPFDGHLISLAASLADADAAGENRYRAGPGRSPTIDDAVPARLRKIPAITITDGRTAPWLHREEDTLANVDDVALQRATEFTVGLVRLLDREAGRTPPAATE